MNSLNILSGRVSAPQSPLPSRSNSYGDIFSSSRKELRKPLRETQSKDNTLDPNARKRDEVNLDSSSESTSDSESHITSTTKTPQSRWLVITKRIMFLIGDSIRWIFSTLSASSIYIITNLNDEKNYFEPISQIVKLGKIFYGGSRRASTAQALGLSSSNEEFSSVIHQSSRSGVIKVENASRKASSSNEETIFKSNLFQENQEEITELKQSLTNNTPQICDTITSSQRPIRVSFREKDGLHHRKYRKVHSTSLQNNSPKSSKKKASELSPSSLKSPVSPASVSILNKNTNSSVPRRPLIPRFQPSYSQRDRSNQFPVQKTLILDLDETLIHSMAKGGRMSTGHMVEVKLNTIVLADGNPTIGLQHPILYWVNKRPHCDEFLRLVCKWYNLIIFTASVQEYADPVIDLLEQERKLFSGRFYRQHCTYRQGAFIKDLSFIEPDLSKVMILDNSPLSYMFHQENAIPIQGWINDPTDNDLLHLVPLLESLQYVTDVRAFLALRGGEDGKFL